MSPLTLSVSPPIDRWIGVGKCARTPLKAAARSRRPRYIGCETGVTVSLWRFVQPWNAPGAFSTTRRSGRATGSGRSITWSSSVKMAVLAPLPSAIVTTTIAAKAGFFRNERRASRKSVQRPSIHDPPRRGALLPPQRDACQGAGRAFPSADQGLGTRGRTRTSSDADAAVPRSGRGRYGGNTAISGRPPR